MVDNLKELRKECRKVDLLQEAMVTPLQAFLSRFRKSSKISCSSNSN
jgi:hypothetical protein